MKCCDTDEIYNAEDVEIFSDYGNGFSWNGKASKNSKVITSPTMLEYVSWSNDIPKWVLTYSKNKGWNYEHLGDERLV